MNNMKIPSNFISIIINIIVAIVTAIATVITTDIINKKQLFENTLILLDRSEMMKEKIDNKTKNKMITDILMMIVL